MKKTRVFLGGYVNHTNAQNLNCRSLARHLDKKRYEVYTLEVYSGDLPPDEIPDVHLFRCFYPFRLSKHLAFLWGVFHADVLYLPKGDPVRYPLILAKLLGKRCFTTVEGVLNDEYIDFCRTIGKDPLTPVAYWRQFENLYAITGYIRRYMSEKFNLRFREKRLYLGIDTETFAEARHPVNGLRRVVMIGNALKEKGLDEYLQLAKKFSDLEFHIVGSGHDLTDRNVLQTLPANVHYHGALNHMQLTKLLQRIDLHILLSKTEGFPKVVIETAAAGVPSLLYSHYGAKEWIENGKEGFLADSFEEVIKIVEELVTNPNILSNASEHACQMAKRFSWEKRIVEWEEVIDSLAKKGKP